MARRRSEENGLKRQQRLESEQREREVPHETTQEGPVPPGVTQLVETAAPPFVAPRPED